MITVLLIVKLLLIILTFCAVVLYMYYYSDSHPASDRQSPLTNASDTPAAEADVTESPVVTEVVVASKPKDKTKFLSEVAMALTQKLSEFIPILQQQQQRQAFERQKSVSPPQVITDVLFFMLHLKIALKLNLYSTCIS